MRRSDWIREYRRARCGASQVMPAALAAARESVSSWDACAWRRAYWLSRPTMRAHKISLVADCRKALAIIRPRLL